MAAKKEPKLKDFKYVDAWHIDPHGKNNSWIRMESKDVLRWQQEEALNFNCFATVQRFANSEKVEGEPFLAPLYFDLDYDRDPAVSQADAIKLIEFFTQELDVRETDIHIYFSGSKGFHILIGSQAVGIKPRADLHKIFKHIAGYLVHRLELTSLDLVVYTNRRQLRLPNSIHAKTKRYKIELSFEEIKTLTLEEIQELAETPRKREDLPFTADERNGAAGIRGKTNHFYSDKVTEYEQAAATQSKRYDKEEFIFKKGRPPVCVQDILENGWKKEGDRNQATVQLACYYKDAGHTKEETMKVLEEWVLRFTSADSNYQQRQRVANTRSVIDSVFSEDNDYKFHCSFIRSLHGEKKPGEKDYDRVACAGELCPCIKKHKEEEVTEVMHLAETGNADHAGKAVKTHVMVAGKKHTPYIVPKKIEYHCWGRDNCKKTHCPLYDIPSHTLYKELGVQDRELIQMTNIGDDNIKGILRDISGIPNCAKYNLEVEDSTNVEELLVIPMAEDESDGQKEDNSDGKYVLRRVYAIGGLPVSENKYYELTGYVYPHPKNQESTLLLRDAKPLQDVVESFSMTDEVKEDFKSFTPQDYTGKGIEEKVAALCADLTYNVTHIVERDETLLGVLLTMHSVLRFKVPWDLNPIRGWVELKVVGDTGTGKSALIEKTMKYAGLGTRVNAESTSRTGLTYKMEQSGSGGAWYIVWGAWPLADKEMIWIDEATGITKDDYGEMTLARSDGKLEVKRAVTAETPCRVRAIMSGNVPRGRRLADYAQGVEALKDIFNNEDIRRFDFAIFMRSTDVDSELYNQELGTYPNMISSRALKNNILYAWSRKPDDVLFAEGTIEKMLSVSTELSKVYGNATDVPLVSPSDQRNKIARLSVALAALTHSVDESGERIQVWPGHVEFIERYLKALYNSPGCGLNYYSKLAIREEEMTEARYNRITGDLKKIDTLKNEFKFFELIKLFAQQKALRLNDIEAMLSIDREEVKEIINTLTRMRMTISTSGGFRKTPRFNAYIAYCMQIGLFDQMDDDDY
ncbi:DNA primase [Bacillus velezensis]|uniref:DNA primase small subunit domain-containing protein n=1 Tax=Bacillus TaxID=1386 RepID=UPI001C52C6FD|nr:MULTISPECIES: DNA primase small subunit domain-containing protein [Bacillus amyloliquefaciens group]QXP99300.1 DNA primase [Bacillus velezensis]UHH01360.1 DNA primase [Bacillus amyloliquefaciens]ULR21107.1 DNA primase [Bacillus velezensis]UVW07850.1 DNA primase [Bacillus velezensis]WHL75157.1 DNA primase [Bacillus velezensis]